MSAYMTFKTNVAEYRWHGGECIHVGYTRAEGVPGIDGDDFHAYDVINLWDERGELHIPRTLAAFEEQCREKDAGLVAELNKS